MRQKQIEALSRFVNQTMRKSEGFELVQLSKSHRSQLERLILAAGIKGRYAHGTFAYTFYVGKFGYLAGNATLTRCGELESEKN